MVTKIKPITLAVYPDEPCWSLFEAVQKVSMPDGSIQRRWVQKLRVVRGDSLAYFETDFGPAENFAEVPPLILPSFGENTVAQLQEMAELHRRDDKWIKRRKELEAQSTLKADLLHQLEVEREVMRNRSHFGPGISVQRNFYDTNVAKRRLRNRRKEYTGIVPQGG